MLSGPDHRRRSVLVAAVMAAAVSTGCATTGASAPTTRSSLSPGTSDGPTTTIAPPPPTSLRPATTNATTTTTIAVPVAPQPSADAAADALVSAWASDNRPVALSVATMRAVGTLFAVAYPPGLAIPRQCSVAFPPIVCTFGPPGGGPVTARVFQLYVAQTPSGGWYVRSVLIES